MTAKFKFREIVSIHTKDPDLQELNGKKGYIIGIGEPNEYQPFYSYSVFLGDQSVGLGEYELITTNEFEPEEEEEPVSIRVFVNENGEGYSPDTDGTFHDENSDD